MRLSSAVLQLDMKPAMLPPASPVFLSLEGFEVLGELERLGLIV
jgi:hypothetical protein